MIKTVKIGKKEVRLDNNVGWTLVYRDQFGRDILPVIMPAIAGLLDIISGVVTEASDENDEINLRSLAKMLDGETVTDAMIHLSGLEFVDFLNITWSLAKNADDSIPEPRLWIKEFEDFPLDVVGPAVGMLIVKGLISSKNLRRLSELLKTVQPKTSNQ